MTDPARITDLLGIDSEQRAADSVWPLNLVLVILGGAILGVAFTFLDVRDERWLYNPWTYALATPVVLLALSALLSTLVSRVVEKSMQLAFMLSVLVHLLLLVAAMNVVIFSRAWPDMFESLDRQREQLKRESLHARQYHRVSISQQSGRRPDYLQPVATEHQPTEVELTANPHLALARAQRPNLVSPAPRIELSHSPNLIERSTAESSPTSSFESTASLSRSDVSTPLDPRLATLPVSPSLDMAQPSPLAPTSADLLRRRHASSGTPSASPDLPKDVRASASASLDRAALASARVPKETEAAAAVPAAEVPKQALSQRSPSRSATVQPLSEASLSELAGAARQPELAPAALEQQATRTSSAARRSAQLELPSASPTTLSPTAAASNFAATAKRSEAQEPSTAPAASDLAMVLPRSIAGGAVGAPAASSLPVWGIDDLGTSQPEPTLQRQLSAAPVDAQRRTQATVAAQLPQLGQLGARAWNGTPSLSGGSSGVSPSPFARAETNGMASAADVADLSGSQRDLERSSLSRAEAPEAGSVRGLEDLPETGPEGQTPADAVDTEVNPLVAAQVPIGRSTDQAAGPNPLSGSPPLDTNVATDRSAFLNVEGPRRAASAESSQAESDRAEVAGTGGQQLERQAALTPGAPGLTQIELPATDALPPLSDIAAASPQPSLATGLSRRQGDQPPAQSSGDPSLQLLEVEAVLGSGGLAPALNTRGALLRRRTEFDRAVPAPLEAQALARRELGGPLAAGQQAAIPKPAFQQRIDRLKDRNPLDESTLEPQTELAIERGLEFLAKHQRPDGSWRLQDFDTPVLMRSDTAATALSVLAFQGAGYTHRQFKYAPTVSRALQFLISHQAANGDLYIPQDPASDQNAWLYSHAIAALALCEAVGMTQDDQLKRAAQKSIDFMVASQDPLRGGWRYRPGVGADTSVTGWFMMALKSGQLAGLNVPPATMQRIEEYLEASQAIQGEPYLFRYNPYAADTPQQRHGLQPTSVMTSVGLLMRLYTGWSRERNEMKDGADYLLANFPQHGTEATSKRDTYYWYYATQVMYHMRGERWQAWHDHLYPLLTETQVTQGPFSGSWDPNWPTPDLWARFGGRLYVTTLNLLSLEVSYRHLPLYEATAR